MGFLTMFSWSSMWSIFGLVSLISAIWFAGPAIAIDKYKPLDTVMARVIATVVVCLIFLGIYLFKLYKTRKMNQHVIEEIKASDIGEEKTLQPETDSELKEQFSNIDNILLREQSKENKNFFQRLFANNGEYIYQKPWFVVVGAPGVGKTSAILNSGLTFPVGTTDHVSKLAGTRDCDWFLTDEALLLDTAGRFVEQNNDIQNTNDWNELLGLLKRCRPKQPINGLVLMLSAEDIIDTNEEKLKLQLQQIRMRLQEMQSSFNTTFPLYIVVNKIDLVVGFNQYFNYIDDQDRKKAFGVSLDPLTETTAEKINTMTDEIDVIVEKLKINLFKTVSYNNQNNDPADLGIGFATEFEKFSHSLKVYLKKMLNLSRYDADLNLAGVYFTSAVQEEDENFILDEQDKSVLQPKYATNQNAHLISKSKSFFLNEIFKILLLDTANTAGIDNNWLKKQRKIYWICAALFGLAFLIFLFLLIRAYSYNSKYQEAVEQQLKPVELMSKNVDPNNISSVLNFTNRVYTLPEYNINKELLNKSFFQNFGLKQHDDISKAALAKHQSLIDENVLPLLSNEINRQLKNSIDGKNYKDVYNNLKAYLMLYQPEHYDKKFIYQWAVNNVLAKTSPDPSALAALEKLINSKKITPRATYDLGLVTQARDLLVYTDVAAIIMQDVSQYTKSLDQRSIPVTSFVTMGGVSTNNIFRRVSARTLNDPVNPLFTKYGYQNIFLPFVNQRLKNVYKEEKWVIGDNAQMKPMDEVIADIYRIYALQYTATWKSYIQDVRMVQPGNLQQAIVMAKQLSEKNSSLAGIIKGISANTKLTADAPAAAANTDDSKNPADVEAAKKAAVNTAVAANKMIDESKVQGYLESISNNFSQFQSLTQTTSESGAQLDEIIKSINDLYVYLVALELSIQSEDQLMPDVRPLVNYKAQVNRLPDPFRPMLDVFVGKITASSQAYKDSQVSALAKQQDQVVQNTCKNLIANKYPFVKSSQQDISIQELAQLFGTDGTYLKTLSSNVMVSENGQVPFRSLLDGGVVKTTKTYSNAEAINAQLFAGKNVPKIDLIMNIKAMDKNIDNLNIYYDSKKIQYFHGPLKDVVMTWPAKDNRFVLEATSADAKPERIEVNGDWSVFRLIDKASKVIATPDGRGVLATFELGQNKVYIEFKAVSGQNPFNLTSLKEFKC
ncbi:type VI secretion system membrane subunit TssM [Acinetobacter gerneri]|uniref:type VI secretion system membrane subunit TssM n=1 Tax=Acinetobacter gerneri TaxID=202952 RepID=UPI0028B0FF9C|nr:type VI secretion system membrane subunit TssM [Acinetobacter gerneri]